MYLIVGLGNPEKEYRWTRHNIGAECINKLAYDNNIEINKAKHKAHFGMGTIGSKKVILCKPQTYMNLSGESVKEIISYYNIELENIIVIYDDIYLDVGDIRVRLKGSAGGQNGMKNIINHLKSENFKRVRVGIGEKPPKMNLGNYVLTKFKKEEELGVIDGITKACDAVEVIIKADTLTAMNKYNKKKKGDEQ